MSHPGPTPPDPEQPESTAKHPGQQPTAAEADQHHQSSPKLVKGTFPSSPATGEKDGGSSVSDAHKKPDLSSASLSHREPGTSGSSTTHATTSPVELHPHQFPGVSGKTPPDHKVEHQSPALDGAATTTTAMDHTNVNPHVMPEHTPFPERRPPIPDKTQPSAAKGSPPPHLKRGAPAAHATTGVVSSVPHPLRKSEPKPFLLPNPLPADPHNQHQPSLRPWADQLPAAEPPKSNTERNFIILGHVGLIASIIFFLFMAIAPGNLVMRPREARKPQPIVKRGNLVVIPTIFLSPDVNDTYVIDLSDESTREKAVGELSALIGGYPLQIDEKHTNCYLEKPGFDKPCFFSKDWIGCNETDGYGYRGVGGSYSPCFVLKIADETGNWTLRSQSKKYLPEDVSSYYDDSFAIIKCYPVLEEDSFQSVDVTPRKGFPSEFFPTSSYDASLYLPPVVSVTTRGISDKRNVSIECGLLAQDTLSLWDNGIVRLHFIFR